MDNSSEGSKLALSQSWVLEVKSENRISENQWLASFNFPVFGSLRQSPFLSSLLSLRSRFLSDARVLLTYCRRTHRRRHHHHCEAVEIRDRPCPHPGLHTRSS